MSNIKSEGFKYVGELKDSKPDGQGTLYFPNGDIYHGEFIDGTIDGYGRVNFADGTILEGRWLNSDYLGP